MRNEPACAINWPHRPNRQCSIGAQLDQRPGSLTNQRCQDLFGKTVRISSDQVMAHLVTSVHHAVHKVVDNCARIMYCSCKQATNHAYAYPLE